MGRSLVFATVSSGANRGSPPLRKEIKIWYQFDLILMRVAAEDGSGLMERLQDKRVWARMDERGDAASPRCALRFCDRLAMHGLRLCGLIMGELRDPEESHP